jgi:hypothetical protein
MASVPDLPILLTLARLSLLIRRDVLELDFPVRDEYAFYGALLDRRDLAPKICGAIVEYDGLEGMSEWSVRALARVCGCKTVGPIKISPARRVIISLWPKART